MTTREAVYAILRRAGGKYVSGERISAALGVSRAAVNAAVQTLRAEGCRIRSATRRGYLLEEAPDLLTAGELAVWLPAERLETVCCLETVDSTNRRLRELAADGAPEGQVLLADGQERGRGRFGRDFFSPRGQGVYLSMLLRPEGAPADAVSLTAWVAAAVCGAVSRVCGVRPGIKWVNDLILDGRKVCGILTEILLESESGCIQNVIVGVGLNVAETEQDFPEALRATATSLREAAGRRFSRAQLAAEIIAALDGLRRDWPGEKARYLREYRAAGVTVGRRVCVEHGGERFCAEAVAVNDDFSLAVRRDDGRLENLSGGEVRVRGLCGQK